MQRGQRFALCALERVGTCWLEMSQGLAPVLRVLVQDLHGLLYGQQVQYTRLVPASTRSFLSRRQHFQIGCAVPVQHMLCTSYQRVVLAVAWHHM